MAPGAEGRFIADDPARLALPVRLDEVDTTGVAFLELEALASDHHGQVAVRRNAQQRAEPVQAQYGVRLSLLQDLPPPDQPLRAWWCWRAAGNHCWASPGAAWRRWVSGKAVSSPSAKEGFMDVTLPICSRLPWRFDLAPLLAALERIDPTAWVAHFNTAYYQGDWSGIDLVAAVDAPIPWRRASARSPAVPCARPIRPGRWRSSGSARACAARACCAWAPAPASASIATPTWARRKGRCACTCRCSARPGWSSWWTAGRCRWRRGMLVHRSVPPAPGGQPRPGPRIHLVLDCMMDTRLREALSDGLPTTPELQPSRGVRAFTAFNEQVQQRPELAHALQLITDPTDFCREAVAAGQGLGLVFGEADVRMAMRQGRQDWSRQWSVR